MERRISSATRFSGHIVTVHEDEVALRDGRKSTREVVQHPGAVAVLAVTATGSALLVEHFRYPVGRTLLEIPAGTREPGEAAIDTARRELAEETGYRAAHILELCRFFSSPGWSTEEVVLFKATGLSQTGHGIDHDEILSVVAVEPARLPVLMRDGMIADAKTILALQTLLANPE